MSSRRGAFPWDEGELQRRVRYAVADYWAARDGQATRQRESGVADAGKRGEVTGGQHLDGFCSLFCDLVRSAGYLDAEIRYRTGVNLPGYFRPSKKWDIVVIRGNRLCAAIELKSQVGSFGNNYNNRTEEAVGSSVDFWTAYREGRMGAHQPWLGYFFFLQDSPGSRTPIRLGPLDFPAEDVWHGLSYAERYAVLGRRLLLERHYSAVSLLLSPRGDSASYTEPSADLGMAHFLKSLYGHLLACAA